MNDSDLRKSLREILLAEESTFAPALGILVDRLGTELIQLYRAWALLSDKVPEAGTRLRPRMALVIQTLHRRLASMSHDDTAVMALATEVVSIDEQQDKLEERLVELKAALACMLGPSQERAVDGLGIKTSVAMPSLKVSEPARVPAEFLSKQPNRKAILRHYAETGEMVAGTSISMRRPAVRVWKL